VYEALPKNLFLPHVVRFLQKLRANLTVMLKVSVLTSKFVLMSRDISEKVAIGVVDDKGMGFLWTACADYGY
jgi:hypothetical protein